MKQQREESSPMSAAVEAVFEECKSNIRDAVKEYELHISAAIEELKTSITAQGMKRR